MLLYLYILEKNCRTIRIYTWFWSMYQGEKCSVIWGGSDALGRLIWVISRKIILIWGFSLSLIVNFFLRELLLSCFVFLIDDFVWLKKKKPKIRSRTKANSLIFRRQQQQPSFHEKYLLPIAHITSLLLQRKIIDWFQRSSNMTSLFLKKKLSNGRLLVSFVFMSTG